PFHPGDLAAREGLEVHAGAEGAARPGQDAHPQVVTLVQFVDRRAHLVGKVTVDRVADLGPVERDRHHALIGADEDLARRARRVRPDPGPGHWPISAMSRSMASRYSSCSRYI